MNNKCIYSKKCLKIPKGIKSHTSKRDRQYNNHKITKGTFDPLWYLVVIVLSVSFRCMTFDPLWYLVVIVLSVPFRCMTFDPLWYLVVIVLSVSFRCLTFHWSLVYIFIQCANNLHFHSIKYRNTCIAIV
jgi:hypothetical protein